MAIKNDPIDKIEILTEFNENDLIRLYMEYVLENEKAPRSVFKFCRENGFTEEQFYDFFGSFEGLKKGIWIKFYNNAMLLIQNSPEFDSFSEREKLLTFYYTFFEILSANRSYVLLALSEEKEILKNLDQLKGLRRKVKGFTAQLIRENNEEKQINILKNPATAFSEGAWLQLLFLINFWMNDNSAKFESTDVAIEKSVNTAFDLFDNTPLERVLDLGKFLWKERMG